MRHLRAIPLPLLVGLAVFFTYLLTGSVLHFGYIGRHIAEARAWVGGPAVDAYNGGVLEVAAYVPSALLERLTTGSGRALSLGNIAYVWVHPLVGALIAASIHGFARDLFHSDRVALATALVAAFGTMLWPYAKFGMEDFQTLFTLLGAWTLWRYLDAPSRGRAVLFAASLGALALTKVTGLVHCAALAAAGGWLFWRAGYFAESSRRADAGSAVAIGAGALAVLFATNLIRYDGWLIGTRYNTGSELTTRYLVHNLLGSIIGPGKSLFLFSPPLLAGALFLPAFLRRFPRLGPVYGWLGLAALWYTVSSAHFMDETWGPRRFHWVVPFLALPVGAAAQALAGGRALRRAGFLALCGAGLCVQVLAVSFDYTAHAFALGKHPVYTISNNTWLPEMSAIRLNAHLFAGKLSGGPSPYVVESEYVPWNAPPEPPGPVVFDVAPFAQWDLWAVQESRAWAGDGWMGRQASSYVFLLVLAGVAVGWSLVGWRLATDRA